MNKKTIFCIALIFLLVFSACTTSKKEKIGGGGSADIIDKQMFVDNDQTDFEKQKTSSAWLDTILKDVKTGEDFKISDYKGKPVLVESFAVWCPNCKRQQQTIQEFHEVVGDNVISVALDTDPNEDEQTVLDHIINNGFEGRYVVSPKDFTQSLIDEFGVGIVNAPSIPMILVCEDQSTRLLDRGHKSIEILQEEISKGCA